MVVTFMTHGHGNEHGQHRIYLAIEISLQEKESRTVLSVGINNKKYQD